MFLKWKKYIYFFLLLLKLKNTSMANRAVWKSISTMEYKNKKINQ